MHLKGFQLSKIVSTLEYVFNDDMYLHMSSLGTVVPEGSWCMFYATGHQVYWGLTQNVVFYWCSDLISHRQIQ